MLDILWVESHAPLKSLEIGSNLQFHDLWKHKPFFQVLHEFIGASVVTISLPLSSGFCTCRVSPCPTYPICKAYREISYKKTLITKVVP